MNALFSCVLNASYYFFELRRNWCGTGIASATPFFCAKFDNGRLAPYLFVLATLLSERSYLVCVPACV